MSSGTSRSPIKLYYLEKKTKNKKKTPWWEIDGAMGLLF